MCTREEADHSSGKQELADSFPFAAQEDLRQRLSSGGQCERTACTRSETSTGHTEDRAGIARIAQRTAERCVVWGSARSAHAPYGADIRMTNIALQ